MGSDAVTVGAHNLALLHLCDDGSPCAVGAHHVRHVGKLSSSHMVQLEATAIVHAAIHAPNGSLVDTDSPPLDSAEVVAALVPCHR